MEIYTQDKHEKKLVMHLSTGENVLTFTKTHLTYIQSGLVINHIEIEADVFDSIKIHEDINSIEYDTNILEFKLLALFLLDCLKHIRG